MQPDSLRATAARGGHFVPVPCLASSPRSRADQRHHCRYRLIEPIPCSVGRLEASLIDLSLVGLAVRAGSPLRIGQSYEIRLRHEGDCLSFPVSITRSYLVGFDKRDGDQMPIYHIGADFRAAINQHAHEILSFLQNHVVVRQPRLLAFVQPHDQNVRNDTVAFPVKSLSSRRFELCSAWPGSEGEPIVVSFRQDERSAEVQAMIRSCQANGRGTYELGFVPAPSVPEAKRALQDLIRSELA